MQVQPPQQAKNTNETHALVYVMEGWVRAGSENGQLCELCQDAPGRYTYETYGYEGIEKEVVDFYESLESGKQLITEEQAAERVLQKLYEAQNQGMYQVAGRSLFCGRCLALLMDGQVAGDDGASIIEELAGSPGKLSCLFVWQLPSEDGKPKIPALLYTEAQTIEEVIPQLREQHLSINNERRFKETLERLKSTLEQPFSGYDS